MSPSPRQSATGQSPRFTAPHWPSSQTARNPELLVASGEATRRGPSAGSGCPMPARVTRKWVSGISTHRVSIRPFHPALDTVSRRVPTFRTLLSSPPAAVDLQRPPSRGGAPMSLTSECLVRQCLHRLPPTCRADCSAHGVHQLGRPSLADPRFHAGAPACPCPPLSAYGTSGLLARRSPGGSNGQVALAPQTNKVQGGRSDRARRPALRRAALMAAPSGPVQAVRGRA